jgi:hypothetical protein
MTTVLERPATNIAPRLEIKVTYTTSTSAWTAPNGDKHTTTITTKVERWLNK